MQLRIGRETAKLHDGCAVVNIVEGQQNEARRWEFTDCMAPDWFRKEVGYFALSSQNKACMGHPARYLEFDQELVRAQAELSPEFGQDSVRQRKDSRIGSCGL